MNDATIQRSKRVSALWRNRSCRPFVSRGHSWPLLFVAAARPILCEGARRNEERAAHYGWEVTCGRAGGVECYREKPVRAGAATLQVRPAGVGGGGGPAAQSCVHSGLGGPETPVGMGGASAGLPPHYSSVDEPAWSGDLPGWDMTEAVTIFRRVSTRYASKEKSRAENSIQMRSQENLYIATVDLNLI